MPKGQDWKTAVTYKGDSVFPARSIIDTRAEIPYFVEVERDPSVTLADGDDVNVYLAVTEGNSTHFFADVPFDTLGDRWFFTDGVIGKDPCAHFEDGLSK